MNKTSNPKTSRARYARLLIPGIPAAVTIASVILAAACGPRAQAACAPLGACIAHCQPEFMMCASGVVGDATTQEGDEDGAPQE